MATLHLSRIRTSPYSKRNKHRKSRGAQVMSRQESKFSSRDFYTCVVLVAITWLVFGQTLTHDFVNFDDHVYVYENPSITRGLTSDGVIGAFVHSHARNWHPLTTISHMLDCQLYGLKAGGHHFTNVLLHSVAVVLLFFVLRQMTGGPSRTGSIWQSAFVASLFAIHPLHVESVAWVSERKDVLSAVFFMLTLGLYVRYARAPSLGRYLAVAVLFALGLMSKPMLVTLPFVLLLLDYWPLNRVRRQTSDVRNQRSGVSREPSARQRGYGDGAGSVVRGRIFKLIVEKIPLFALSAISCVATLLVQNQSAGAIEQLPFMWRLNNAVISYVAYIWQMFWPARLAAFYPHPNDQLPPWQVLLAIAFLIAVSLWAIHWRKERPYIFTGWFWYVGMLVPVIGLVQVGEQARADRYTYLPHIGLFMLAVWLVADLTAVHKSRARFAVAAAGVIIVALVWAAMIQTSYWRNSETLWTHALAVTSDNDLAHNNLGYLCIDRGELDKAISHFEAASRIRSRKLDPHYNVGSALMQMNLADALGLKGQADEAMLHYEEAIKLVPNYADAYYNRGNILFANGRVDEAIADWEKTLQIQPNDANAHTCLGNALLRQGL